MPDSLGWRANWGVVVPSTNTSVQPEFDDMRPRGVTNHIVRIWIPNDMVGDRALGAHEATQLEATTVLKLEYSL